MSAKIFSFLPLRRNLFLQTLTLSRSSSSLLATAQSNNVNVTRSNNAPSENLFLHFVTTRFDISSADAAKMLKRKPSLGRLKTLGNVEQLVSMLNRFSCTEHQIASIIRSQPSLLGTSVERFLEPKLQLLKDYGMSDENISKIVTKLPWILTVKLELLRSNLDLLKTVFTTQDLLIRAIRKNCNILGLRLHKSFEPSVAFWEDFGFRGTELTMFLLVNPWVLARTSLSPEQLDLIRRIGIPKESNMYKYVVSAVAMSRIEVLDARIHNLELCGLSPEQAMQVVRVSHSVLNSSEENVKKKMDFVLNHTGLSEDFVAKYPRIFSMSLDRVIRPRFLVLQNMAAMDGAGEVNPSRLFTIMMMPEAKFVAQIIQGRPEAATLCTVYKNAIANVSDI